jgi:NitT/TauT family transport system substrate-binding protein
VPKLGSPKNSEEPTTNTQNRRQFLTKASAAVSAGALTGLAGCTSMLGGSSSMDTLNIAFKPPFPFLQYHVMNHEGYFEELDPDIQPTNFANKGLTIVSAYADGDVDLGFIGITPAIKMKSRGVPGKVTAANHKNGFVVLAHKDFAALWDEHGADAFEQFREQKGRKFKFSTFPKGSVAFILLQYWLREELGVSPDLVEIEPMAGGSPVKRSLLSGNVDGTVIMEPIPTALEAKGAPFERIIWAGSFMSGQPGGIMFMHDRLWSDNPDLATAIVEKHTQATEIIQEQPSVAAEAVSKAKGEKLPTKIARKALDSKASNYISDPAQITNSTQLFVDQMEDLGQIDTGVSNDTIFEQSLYDDVAE